MGEPGPAMAYTISTQTYPNLSMFKSFAAKIECPDAGPWVIVRVFFLRYITTLKSMQISFNHWVKFFVTDYFGMLIG